MSLSLAGHSQGQSLGVLPVPLLVDSSRVVQVFTRQVLDK